MRTMTTVLKLACLALLMFISTNASAHPGSGIVVDKAGNVYFTDTGQGTWKIDTQGRVT